MTSMSPRQELTRWWALGLGLTALTVLLVLVTKWTAFGEQVWHYNVSFAATTVLYVAFWKPLSRNRVLIGIPLLVSAVLAIVSGFFLLYAKEWVKATGWKDVAKYWHSLTSWLLLLLAMGHFVVNWKSLWRYFKTLYLRIGTGTVFTVTWLVITAIVWVSVLPAYKVLFTDGNYLFISSLSILGSTVLGYGLWILWKGRTGAWGDRQRRTALGAVPNRRTPGGFDRPSVRRHLDTHMFLWYWFAQVSGLVLLYFKDFLHGNGFKYVSKFWHTAPSAVVTVMLFAHVAMSWPLMGAYWQRWKPWLVRVRPAVPLAEVPEPSDDL